MKRTFSHIFTSFEEGGLNLLLKGKAGRNTGCFLAFLK